MEIPVNVLILEDRPADAELMVEELRKEGFVPKWRRVDTERDYLAALDPGLDVILADHSLPQYDSVRALERLHERRLDVPFIVVSGTINEELAVALMKHGAADYLIKDRMARLGQAVFQAVQQTHLRRDKRRIEQALSDEQAWFRALTEKLHEGIVVLDAAGVVLYASPSSFDLMGYTPASTRGTKAFAFVHPEDVASLQQTFADLVGKPGETFSATVRGRHASGSWRWLEVMATNRLKEVPLHGIVLTYRDVTAHRQAEQALRRSEDNLQRAQAVAHIGSWNLDLLRNELAWTDENYRIFGIAPGTPMTYEGFLAIVHPDDRVDVDQAWSAAMRGAPYDIEHRIVANGRIRVVREKAELEFGPDGAAVRGLGITQDITGRKEAEKQLRLQAEALESAANGIVITDRDGAIVWVNEAFAHMTGYRREEVVGGNPRLLKSGKHDPSFYKSLWSTILEGKVWRGELVNRRKDGTLYTDEMTITPVSADGHGITHFIAIKQDITERKQTEASLRTSESKLSAISTAALDAIIMIDGEGIVVFWNPAAEAILGYSSSEIMGKNFHDVVPPKHFRPEFERGLTDFKQTGQGPVIGKVVELSAIHRDGHEFPVELSLAAARLGEQWCAVGILRDISPRKRAEQHLRESEERFALAVEGANDGIWDWNLLTDKVYFSPRFKSMIGYEDHEFDASYQAWEQRLHAEDLAGTLKHLHDYLEGRTPIYAPEFRLRHKDGSYRWILARAVASRDATGKPTRLTGSHTDITERKQAEVALAERARLAVLTADVAISLTQQASLPGILQHCTEALVRHLDVAFARIWTLAPSADTLELQASAGLYTHLDGPHARVPVGKYKIGRIAQDRKPHLTNQAIGDPRVHDQDWARREGMTAFAGHPLIVADKVRGVMAVFSRLPLSETTCDALAAVANQVALGIDRKQAEDELRSSEERFRRITTNMLDLVVQVNLEGLYEYVTPSTLSVLGYRPEEMLGHSFFPLLHPDDRVKSVAAFETAMKTGDPAYGEYRVRRASGEYIWLEVVGTRLLDDRGSVCGALIASRDVTARRRAEEEIRQLNTELEQKVRDRTAQLEAANKELEAFAYSVSHDLRAPLRGIDGFSQALLEDYRDKLDAEGQNYLRRVRAASQRMGQLIDDILQLSRMTRAPMAREEVDLSALAMRVFADLQSVEPERHVEIRLTPGLTAHGDARLLEVVFTNLLGNAWKFTSKTESPRIEVGVTDHEGHRAFFVSDNGAGFDMAYADRLFGAFQRLHSNEEFPGTGVGLATVQRIIRRHGGQIWAQGEVGKGATFLFTLGSNRGQP